MIEIVKLVGTYHVPIDRLDDICLFVKVSIKFANLLVEQFETLSEGFYKE